jgi:acyl carrier protein
MPAYTEQEILAGLAELVNEETGIAVDEIQPEKAFVEDLDIDSLSMMTIVVNAQDKFDVEIPDDAVTNLKTVADAVAYITKAQSAVAGA